MKYAIIQGDSVVNILESEDIPEVFDTQRVIQSDLANIGDTVIGNDIMQKQTHTEAELAALLLKFPIPQV
jgi:hypothetical protein